jgi:NIPSNAP
MSWPHEPDTRVLDVRTYKLVPGGRDDFDRLFRESVLPMLHRFGIDVVGYGPSADGHDQYYLMRAFASSARRDKQLDAFYGSDEWRRNYREAALELIETYHVVVIELTPTTRDALTSAMSADAVR